MVNILERDRHKQQSVVVYVSHVPGYLTYVIINWEEISVNPLP